MAKILFVINSLDKGGAERVASMLALSLSDYYEVSFVLLCSENTEVVYDTISDLKFLNVEKPSNSLLYSLFNLFVKIIKLRSFIKYNEPEVIISFSLKECCISVLSSAFLSKKLYLCEHTHPKYSNKFGRFWEGLRVILYRYSSKVVVLTKDIESWMKDNCGVETVVIPNPVADFNVIKKNSHHGNTLRIISVGRLSEEKGFHRLLSVAKILSEEGIDFELNIYGDGHLKSILEGYIYDYGLTRNVYLRGNKKNIEFEIANSDIYLSGSFYEGFPMAVCEAMSIGIPIIAFEAPGVSELIESEINGILVKKDDFHTMAKKIIEFSEGGNRSFYDMLTVNSKKIVENYSVEKVTKKWIGLIDGKY